jgi:hypothetical protein
LYYDLTKTRNIRSPQEGTQGVDWNYRRAYREFTGTPGGSTGSSLELHEGPQGVHWNYRRAYREFTGTTGGSTGSSLELH